MEFIEILEKFLNYKKFKDYKDELLSEGWIACNKKKEFLNGLLKDEREKYIFTILKILLYKKFNEEKKHRGCSIEEEDYDYFWSLPAAPTIETEDKQLKELTEAKEKSKSLLNIYNKILFNKNNIIINKRDLFIWRTNWKK